MLCRGRLLRRAASDLAGPLTHSLVLAPTAARSAGSRLQSSSDRIGDFYSGGVCCPRVVCGGMLHPTRVSLFLPQLGRLLAAGGVVLAQAFLLAYAREKQRAKQRDAEEGDSAGIGDSNSKEGHGRRTMTPLEAIHILGVEKANPALEETFRSLSQQASAATAVVYPILSRGSDREVARENFERMFGLAVKHNNQFLAGKLSLAFRICVDPRWDERVGESGSPHAADVDGDAAPAESGKSDGRVEGSGNGKAVDKE